MRFITGYTGLNCSDKWLAEDFIVRDHPSQSGLISRKFGDTRQQLQTLFLAIVQHERSLESCCPRKSIHIWIWRWIVLWRLLSLCTFCCSDKTLTKSKWERKRFILVYRLQLIFEGVGAGIEANIVGVYTLLLTGLPPLSYSDAFPTVWSYQPKMVLLTVPLMSINY